MSWQLSALTAILRRVVRPHMQRVRDPVRIRAEFDRMTRLGCRPPPYLCHLTGRDGQHRISVGVPLDGKVILYFHGGGYISGSPHTHAAMLGRLSQLSGLEVCAAPYPLAPEAPFPAAFEAAVAAWESAMQWGYRPSDVVLGGDSAGGGLALALLSYLCQCGTPPAALFAMSPWCDLTLSGESLTRNAARDPVFPAARIGELVGYVLPAGSDPADPRISPLFGAFPDCPPVLLHSSAEEILCDDARRMAEVLRGFGAEVTEQVHPTAPHVWHLCDGWLPEARLSLCDIAYFANAHLRA